MSGFSTLSQACLVAVAYCDQFGYALTATEVWQRLPGFLEQNHGLAGVSSATTQAVREELAQAVALEILQTTNWQGQEYYFLNPDSHPQYRTARSLPVAEAERSVEQLRHFLEILPWVQALGITGSLAMRQVAKADDVDVCIVTLPGTLWLTRALVSIYSWWSGHWRSWDEDWQEGRRQQRPFRWCLNMWLEQHQDTITWSPSLYTAYEIAQVRWVWDRGGVEKWLLQRNWWVREWLPHAVPASGSKASEQTQQPQAGAIYRVLNEILYLIQRIYMWPHLTTERVTRHEALFHPRATSQLVQVGWLSSLRRAITRLHWRNRWQSWLVADELHLMLEQAHVLQIPITLVTGVFDVLHREHIAFLEKAKSLGGLLLVAIESDERVRALKGADRPVHTAQVRQKTLINTAIPDQVLVLPTAFSRPADYRAFLEWCRPRYLAVSSHSPHQEVKADMMKAIGGSLVVVHEHNPAISTTLLIEKYRPQ